MITSKGGLTISILASIAEFERELIQARMTEGRKRAVNNGVKFGRPHKLDAFQKREALKRLDAGESQSLVARTYGVSRATISRWSRLELRWPLILAPAPPLLRHLSLGRRTSAGSPFRYQPAGRRHQGSLPPPVK